jgi:hypothetical protein
MSAEELPEDVRAWPNNPYELFGVPPHVDAQSLRRVYHRLLRRFKPEQFPEQFMRIRAAYERLKFQAEQRASWGPISPAEEDSAAEASTPEAAAWGEPTGADLSLPSEPSGDGLVHRQKLVHRQTPSPDLLAATAWQRAIGGECAAAYHELRELFDRHPEHFTVPLQLYWLLRIAPEMDAERVAEDWLVGSIRRHGSRVPAWGLYLDALRESATEALTARCTSLLSLPLSCHALRALLDLRWRAAAAAGNWNVIELDLMALRESRCRRDPLDWMSVLFLVSDHVAWSKASPACELFLHCAAELRTFSDYELEADEAFDHYARLTELTAVNRMGLAVYSPPPAPPRLMELVRHAWNRPAFTVRPEALAVVNGWVDDPPAALAALDELREAYPLHLAMLHQLFSSLGSDAVWMPGEQRLSLIRPVIYPVLKEVMGSQSYGPLRRKLTLLGLLEGVTIDEVIEVGLAACPNAPWSQWCQNLYEDLALRTLLAGLSAYWS